MRVTEFRRWCLSIQPATSSRAVIPAHKISALRKSWPTSMRSSRAKRRHALSPRNKASCRLLAKLVYFVEQMAINSGAERMARLGIRDVDLKETFARSSGPGGQNVNKVTTAVTLRHQPSGIGVTVQDSRSQAMNRKLARERLLDAIDKTNRKRRA